LCHAVVGGRASISSFLEAVVAEAGRGVGPEILESTPRLSMGARREAALAMATENWAFLRRINGQPDVVR
jgi:hypothetical protein